MTHEKFTEWFDDQHHQPKLEHLHVHNGEMKSANHVHHYHHKLQHDSVQMTHSGHLPHLHLTDRHGETLTHSEKRARLDSTPQIEKTNNDTVKFGALHGAAVDTDGVGAHRHKEDRTRQSHTSYTLDGRSLDTDKDKFVALPKSVMRENNIHLGDHGVLVRSDNGQRVSVIFGDVSNGKQWKKGQPEASVAALKELGFSDVTGANGVSKNVPFELIMTPGSKGRKFEA